MRFIKFSSIIISGLFFSQEQSTNSENSFNLNFGMGYSKYNTEKYVSTNLNSTSASISYSHSLKKDYSIEGGLGVVLFSGKIKDNIYVADTYLSLPINFKANLYNKNKINLYSGIGILPTYKISSNTESNEFIAGDELNFLEEKGGNFLVGLNVGGVLPCSEKYGLVLGFSYYIDALQYGYNNNRKYENYASFNIGVRFF